MKHLWRAWLPEEKMMTKPFGALLKYPLRNKNGALICEIYISLNNGKFRGLYTDSDFIFMSSAGKKDIHGKMLFEKDIIMGIMNGYYMNKPIKLEVLCDKYKHQFFVCDPISTITCHIMPKCFEIIGNAYENPELLQN